MPGVEVNNPMRTIVTTSAVINNDIDIRKINLETFILLLEKCNLCAVCLQLFDCRMRVCVIDSNQPFKPPAISQMTQITSQLAGSQTPPQME